jgi:hypothetical protein
MNNAIKTTKKTLVVCIVLLLTGTIFISGCVANTTMSAEHSTATSLQHASQSGQSPLCPNPPTPTVTDFNVRQVPSMAEPSPRAPFTDPVFGTCVVRVTDRNHDIAAGDPSTGLKNEYSRVQSFNADETKLIVLGTRGTWYLYDANTLQLLGQLPFNPGECKEPRWDASNPNVFYYSASWGTRLMGYNVQTQEKKVVHDFAGDFPGKTDIHVSTKDEGSPSRDTRYWGLMAQDTDWKTFAFLIYDRQADRIIAKKDVKSADNPDWVSISPLGDFFIADYQATACPSSGGDEAHPCDLMIFDTSLHYLRTINTKGGHICVAHGDLALNSNGREVFVFQDACTDFISMVDLQTGTTTKLIGPIDFSSTTGNPYLSFHISGQAYNRPGWVLVSTTDDSNKSSTWMDKQVFAVELKPNGRVVRLAHDHTVRCLEGDLCYWAEPHGSVNRDFTRVLFTSNWGRLGTAQIDMYMVVLPKGWI